MTPTSRWFWAALVAESRPSRSGWRLQVKGQCCSSGPAWRLTMRWRRASRPIRRNAADARVVLVDCLSFLVSNCLFGSDGTTETLDEPTAWRQIEAELREMGGSA